MKIYRAGYVRSSTGCIHINKAARIGYILTACGMALTSYTTSLGPEKSARGCKLCKVVLSEVFLEQAWIFDSSGIPLYEEPKK